MRALLAVASTGALAVALTACGSSAPEATSSLSFPASLPEEPTAAEQDTNEGNYDAGAAGTASGKPGMDDCLIVAAGVSSVLLAPLEFMGEDDQEALDRLEGQLHRLEEKVPADVGPHFAKAADAAKAETSGAGGFDEAAFRAALDPVESWLEEHCGESSG